MITIGIIDSYKIIRYGLTALLHEVYDQIEILESDNIPDFAMTHGQKKVDVLILGNNSLVPSECFEAVVMMRKHFPDAPLIVYDENLKQNLTTRYFELNVNGYLLKQSIASEIARAISTVLAKNHFICPALLESLLMFVTKKDMESKEGKVLTAKESQIALYLSQGKKTSWIANTLGRKPSTISTQKSTIFKKMKVENIVQLKSLYNHRNLETQYNR